MDDRKKQISDLGRRKKEQAILLDSLLSQLGETLFGRMADSPQENVSAIGEMVDYRRFRDDIAASQTSILSVEEQIRRMRELEEGIEVREREESAFIRDLLVLHGSLGKLLMDAATNGSEYSELYAPYRDQAEALMTKVDSLEDRLAALEQREKGNVFTWIGKSAQGLVLHSFLTKAQENLEQLRRNMGERYSRSETGRFSGDDTQVSFPRDNTEIERLCTEIEQKREELRALSQDLETLREEKRKISGSFSTEGDPLKQIQNLKKHIIKIQDEMKALYMQIGREAVSVNQPSGDTPSGRREIFDVYISSEDQETLESVERAGESIRQAETEIEKLRASLAIDDEKAKIEKFRKMIQDKRNKITQAEKNIAEYENRIRDSEASIVKLQDLL